MYSRTHALPAPSEVHALFYLFPSYLTLLPFKCSTEVTKWFQEAATRLGHRLADTMARPFFSFGTGWQTSCSGIHIQKEGWEDIFGKKSNVGMRMRKGPTLSSDLKLCWHTK